MLLDDVRRIQALDKHNMMANVLRQSLQIREAIEAVDRVELPREYSECRHIVAVGMGGSGIPGDFLRVLFQAECAVPILVHKDYDLPAFVGTNTLVFAVSYSGTTEETIDALSQAMRRNARIFGIASGDRLLQMLKDNGIPHFAPPAGRATRECFGYLLFAMVGVLQRMRYVPNQDASIAESVSLLDRLSRLYAPETAATDNEAKSIATQLQNTMPILYGSLDLTDVVALRWKQQINENSKALAQLETFPDVTHNQLAAIAHPAMAGKNLAAVLLRTHAEPQELARRIDAMARILEERGIRVVQHWAEGTTHMARLLSQSYLGDFVSLYLAFLNDIDPTPTAGMSELKSILGLRDLSP